MANSHSADFDRASTEYAYVLNDGGITGGTITIEAWIKPSGNPAHWAVAYQGDVGNHVGYILEYRDDGGTITLTAQRSRGGVAANRANYAVTLSTSAWTHVVLTYDSTNVKLYTAASGGTHTERASAASSGNGTGFELDAMSIATDYTDGAVGTARVFDGLIDEVRVWNDVRTTTEMDNNFEKELAGDEAGLVAYYKLNNNWEDSQTSGSYDLTAVNTPTFSTDVPFTGAAGPASMKTRDTIAKASVKTVDGIAIASVKTIDTIA